MRPQEFEVDYDCAASKLKGYEFWLRSLGQVVHPTPLVITTLPAWLDQAEFPALVHQVDSYVLQVHSVPTLAETGHASLCDPVLARDWVGEASRIGAPFTVALPTYWCMAGFDTSGKLVGVAMDSVQPSWPAGTRMLEFGPNADEIADLTNEWRENRPPGMRGIVWYRLPVATDQRNWRWPTLLSVMAGKHPEHHLQVTQNGQVPVDLSLANTGNAEEDLHCDVVVHWIGSRPVACDALPGWSVTSSEGQAVFSTTNSYRLRLSPGANTSVGWIRLAQGPLHFKPSLSHMNKRLLSLTLLGIIAATRCWGTGYDGPIEYLGGGGKNVVATPEFYWELEVKRLARDFHPTEKPMVVPHTFGTDGLVDPAPMIKATSDADAADFADAIKTGEIKPPDVAKATEDNNKARMAVTSPGTGPLGEEFDSEFADYHRGAYAYRQGPTHYDDAKKAWLALLNRPASERHYRTIWASFMLGKLAMKAGDPDAVKWFEKTRDLAKQGFADSLGMAADSYGWEGRSEWKQGHPEKAAPLFLTQLALGDESAIVSLKALVPDRVSIDGTLNFGPDNPPAGAPDNGAAAPVDPAILAALKAAASDPLLRRLVTAHILATGWGSRWPGYSPDTTNTRSQRWLQTIGQVKPENFQDAEYLGWLAYMVGDYKQAQHWLDLSKSTSPAAEWLHAKLQLRAGNLDAAVKSLAAAVDALSSPPSYTGWSDGAYHDANKSGPTYESISDDDGWTMSESANGDLGLMHLEGGDFVQAMDLLLKGGLWHDASYIAERVLSADELKAYVDRMPPPPPNAKPAANDTPGGMLAYEDDSSQDNTTRMRNLLGRRLVREDRYHEAAKYLASPYDKVVQKYAQALKDGADTSLPKEKRAKAYFTAAWLAKYDGMELMGTEVSPDGFVAGGDFPDSDFAQERLSGRYMDDSQTKTVASTTSNGAPATKAEIARVKKNQIEPDKRYHYRYIAAAVAMRAAPLLPDQTEELADVVNTAGNWIKNSDEEIGNRYFQVIDRRCAKTKIGAQASAAHWFVDSKGPWSTEEAVEYDAMHKSFGDDKTAEQ